MEIDVSKLSTQPSVKVERLYVTVYLTERPDQVGFKGFAKSVSSYERQGRFDILPLHENFVTEFVKELIIVAESGESVSYPVKRGVLEVASNVVRVFLKT
ncbi:MAG TPA: hypothetical protein VIH52_00510 [Candidatus Nanoarchaeia archaeon]